MAWRCKDRGPDCAQLWYVLVFTRRSRLQAEEGSESTLVNGDSGSEKLASELGPSCQSLEGTRNVNIESLYEVSGIGVEDAETSVWISSWCVEDIQTLERV